MCVTSIRVRRPAALSLSSAYLAGAVEKGASASSTTTTPPKTSHVSRDSFHEHKEPVARRISTESYVGWPAPAPRPQVVRDDEHKPFLVVSRPYPREEVAPEEYDRVDEVQSSTTIKEEARNAAVNGEKKKRRRRRRPQKPGWTAKMQERHFVQHNYHDHSQEEVDDDEWPVAEEDSAEDGGGGAKNKKKQGSRVLKSFPYKLHQMLDKIAEDGHGDIISWLPHGRAFVINKPKTFVSAVMPKYFNQTKLTSFQRQLNLYGFLRISRGRDEGAYYNEYFLQGKPRLTKHIQRTRVKGTKFKAAASPEQEPNFWMMPFVNGGGPASYAGSNRSANDNPVVSEDEVAPHATGGSASVSSGSANEEDDHMKHAVSVKVAEEAPSHKLLPDRKPVVTLPDPPLSSSAGSFPSMITVRSYDAALLPFREDGSPSFEDPVDKTYPLFSSRRYDATPGYLDPRLSRPVAPNIAPSSPTPPWPSAADEWPAPSAAPPPFPAAAMVSHPPSRSDSGSVYNTGCDASDDTMIESTDDPLLDFVREWAEDTSPTPHHHNKKSFDVFGEHDMDMSNDIAFGRMLERILED